MLIPPMAASDGNAIARKGARMPVMSFPDRAERNYGPSTAHYRGQRRDSEYRTVNGPGQSHELWARESVAEFLVWMLSRSIPVFNFCSTPPRNIVA